MKPNNVTISLVSALILFSLASIGMFNRYEGSLYLKGYGIDLKVKGKPSLALEMTAKQDGLKQSN